MRNVQMFQETGRATFDFISWIKLLSMHSVYTEFNFIYLDSV